ncbi:MAG: hypothetical protein ABI555_05520 [Chloroflexota bacterium]
MGGSVAQGPAPPGTARTGQHWLDLLPSALIGGALITAALAAYWLPGSVRYYNHFVWQAMAFLDGRAAITWPAPGNDFFQDVFPVLDSLGHQTGFGLLPFPPLPAIVLMPFVALFGLATDQRAVSVVLGAVDVGLCWWALGRLPISRPVRLAVTIFFGFGTVFWYTAELGTTWFFAHVVALAMALLAVGIALSGDRGLGRDTRQPDDAAEGPIGGTWSRGARAVRAAVVEIGTGLLNPLVLVDRRQFVAGFFFGLACTARLTIVFGAPFFIFVGSGGSAARRAVSAGLGAAIPILALLAYNVATTGHLFHPGYEYLYRLEANGYAALGYHPNWSVEDLRYVPQNLQIMLSSLPSILPDRMPGAFGPGEPLCTAPGAVRGLFDPTCPIALPQQIGMSLLLTSPAYLLMAPALRQVGRGRLVTGAVAAVLAIAFVNLMHFSQGWVQFGYRFSNDFVVFALPLVALGMERRGGLRLVPIWLIGISVAINFWGMTWGNLLGW